VIEHFEAIEKNINQYDIDSRFFEILTMMALLEFRRKGCQYAVLECGIGGKLDATNIVDTPVCSAITTIGLDHMDVIGNTKEEISAEKSGVIKSEIPCVIGPTCSKMQPIYDRA
jgi:dihydrofolate synthase/folylpolyglutamate synthase